MLEKIYTIPINEAFDASIADSSCGCPFCTLSERLQEEQIDLILGASMMEPDIRIKTNKEGFCTRHFTRMLTAKNRLGLALIMESHLSELHSDLKGNLLSGLKGKGTAACERIERLEESCYICERVESIFVKMLENTVWLWEKDRDFRDRFASIPYFCLPHYKRLLIAARGALSKKLFSDFADAVTQVTMTYFESLREDVSWFCRKFDYRYDAEPWGNAKDAPDRTVSFLKSRDEIG